jgi:hypothetical protein
MDMPQFPAGRKIFYFFPSGNYHRMIVTSIIEAEYEIYTLSDYRKGLPLMFQHNGAVVFLNIEHHLKNEQLLAMIRDFCQQSSHRSIILYLLSRNDEHRSVLSSLGSRFPSCTYLPLPADPGEAAALVHRELEELNVRGQRRYVRFGTNSDRIAAISFERRGKRYSGTVHDISSAGLSFSLEESSGMVLRSRLKEVHVGLSGGLGGLSGTVTIRRKLPDGTPLYILIFDKQMDPALKRRLRTVIHRSLQQQFARRLEQIAVPD